MADSNFLNNLSDILGYQYLAGDNKLTSLDIVENGKVKKFGKLGSFADKVDQTADRSYVMEGSFKTHFNNSQPKQREITLQDPEITILVKKRMFSSLSENFRLDLMDEQDKLFYRSSKVLFQNKCQQIAAFEALSKINQVSTQIGQVDYHLLPIIFGLTDLITDGSSSLDGILGSNAVTSSLSSFKNVVDQVREVVALNQDFQLTTWHTNIKDTFKSTFGEGTGVMEFTNVQSVDTNTTLDFGGGSFGLNFSDPYRLMKITNNDIEKAISDATNKYYNNVFTQLGSIANETINIQKQQLNLLRQSRNVNNINFIIEPNTFLGKRIIAIIDLIGFEIKFSGSSIGNIIGTNDIDPSALQNSIELTNLGYGEQGLSSEEAGLFSNIISALFNQMSLMENTRRRADFFQKDASQGKQINELRKKLYLHYSGKYIIQPMDSVSIFISSKKKLDSKINGGLQTSFNALGLFQNAGNLLQNINDTLNTLSGNSIEKSIFVGSDFPDWLWLAMRSKFVADKEGICIFSGVTENVNGSFSNGVYTLNVRGRDNSAYFDYGLINLKPSVDVYNGPLYDPLTPFDLKFDSISGVASNILNKTSPELLKENKDLFTSVFVRNKNGLLAGVQATAKDYLTPDNDIYSSNASRQSYYDPEGMVYRWKEGIATLTFTGDTYDSTTGSRGVTITKDPFAGQDIMNVLSLLITGEPYNYATYYKAAIGFDTLKRDPITNQVSAVSYYKGLRSDLKNRNAIYGDFIPFKSLTIDETSLEQIISGQLTALSFNQELQTLITRRATLADQLNVLSAANNTTTVNQIQNELSKIDTRISSIKSDLINQANRPGNPGLKFLGNDVSFDQDLSDFGNFNNSAINPNPDARRDLRKKITFLTRRLAWKTRANEDNNLLIVDDTYDKDYDIQAFEKVLGNLDLFRSEYQTAASQINVVAKKLELEVFANTQGHIEIRNPKYNRMPSSVFYRMLKTKDETGVQVFPQFLEDLFTNQLSSLFDQISTIEAQIRLYCLALGKVSDTDCISLINTSDGINTNTAINSGSGGFNFISNPDGSISQAQDLLNIQSNPDQLVQTIQTKLDTINNQNSISAFSVLSRASILQNITDSTTNQSSINSNIALKSLSELRSTVSEQTREDILTKTILNKSGQQFDFSQLFGNSGNSGQQKTLTNTDVIRLTNQIAIFLTNRQQIVKNTANALQNLQAGLSLDSEQGANKLLFSNLYNTKTIPKLFEHMIEDESYDDLGVGSGSRYVIKNRDIIQYNLSDNRPRLTNIEVKGTFDLFIEDNNLPSGLNIFNNGNALSTAAAVDYDMWRMYGISGPQQTIEAPFLHDPETQLAPYAVSILTRARKEIFRGNITIIGNEYQQPGEVVYLEEEDFLYYVKSVHHTFTYQNSFQTTLELTYGHNPGEYVPTPLDVIGKVLYKNNKKTASFDHRRQGNVFNQEHLGTFVANLGSDIGSASLLDNPSNLNDGVFSNTNATTLQKIISQASTALAIQSDFSNPILELRIFYNTNISEFSGINSNLFNYTDIIKQMLLGNQDTISIPTANTKPNTNKLSVSASQIVTLAVDMNEAGEFRYPSSQAFHLARQIIERYNYQINQSSNQQTKIDEAIYNFIIDAWIYFKNPQINRS